MAGWFDEQIKNRIRYDEESVQTAFAQLSSVVVGKSGLGGAVGNNRIKTKNAIEEVLKYYHIKPFHLPEDIEDINDQLEYLLRPTGIMRRVVTLEGAWWKNAVGPMLGQTAGGDVVALLPRKAGGYEFLNYESGKTIRLSKRTSALLKNEAFCFYKPLPLKKLGFKDLVSYIISTLSIADVVLIALATFCVSLLGMLSPYVTRLLFDKIVPLGKAKLLLPMTVLLMGASLSSAMIGIVKSLLMTRIQTKMNIPVAAAAMSRLFSLPATFFKEFNSGELSARVNAVSQLCQMLSSALLSTGLTAVFSFVYIFQMASFSPALVAPALLIILIELAVTIATALMQIKLNRRRMELGAKLNALTFSCFSGVQKIKLAGAEHRVFSKWAEAYRQTAELAYAPPAFIKYQSAIVGLISMAGTIAIYYGAAISEVSVADYMAFNASFGMVSGAIMALAGITASFANIKPLMEMVEPILNETPEIGEAKRTVSRLSGNIELNNVSFRYNDEMPMVLDNISLKIRSGQYIALVGKTGCGKSTLMRLLLGMETPGRGAIYFDGQDVTKLDLRSLRQNIGSVMQNGQLFAGDIYANIVVTAPWLTLDDAWQAAETAGIADDIRDMPMGMHTIIAEGSGGISGGQRQRILIARAIVSKPRILIFDEATSALDNISQKRVSEALDVLRCTRIVIAHRLSTIRHCDRIVVLDNGKITEDGSYEDLIAKNGVFSELVKRQRLDEEEYIGKTTVF